MKKLLIIAIAVFGAINMSSAQDLKVAHFSLDSIYTNLPSSRQAMDFLKEKSTEEEDKIVMKRKDLKKKQDVYLKDKATLPAAIREIKENELNAGYQELESMQYTAQQTIEQYQTALTNPILERIIQATENVSKKLGYTYVLESKAIVYAGGKDLTNEILKEALKLDKEATEETTNPK